MFNTEYEYTAATVGNVMFTMLSFIFLEHNIY
jgi:hypothetical protein